MDQLVKMLHINPVFNLWLKMENDTFISEEKVMTLMTSHTLARLQCPHYLSLHNDTCDCGLSLS
jgi:hypothetical protein